MTILSCASPHDPLHDPAAAVSRRDRAYPPTSGQVLDVGCGFGLFALHFATQNSHLRIRGFDLSERRVNICAEPRSGSGEQCANDVADAASFRFDSPITAAYMLDLIHHIPERSVAPLIDTIASNLSRAAGCSSIIESSPGYVWFHLGAGQADGLQGACATGRPRKSSRSSSAPASPSTVIG
jgi:SAM-dependent methyltransferase